MADTTLPGVLLDGDHASRPAANTVATGSLYACSTHDLIYQSDGSAWSTWADMTGSSGGVLTTQGDILYRDGSGLQRLAIGTASQVLTVNAGATAPEWAAGGGGGGGWTLGIDESGASFANFTSESGTWASSGSVIQQTLTGATHRRARHNTLVPHGAGLVIQAEMQMGSGSTGADAAMGFLIGHAGGNAGSQRVVVLEPGSDTVQWEHGGAASIRTVAHTLNLATWYTLRVAVAGEYISAYVDGTLKGTAKVTVSAANADYIGLVTYDAVADFRNFKVWTPTLP